MSAASAARRQHPNLEIVVLEATGFAAYGMCGLPYYLAGIVETSDALLAHPPEYFVTRRGIDLRLRARVEAVDVERRTVAWRRDGRTGREHWDALVVTTGGSPVVPPVPGLDGDRVFTVRTMEDAIRL